MVYLLSLHLVKRDFLDTVVRSIIATNDTLVNFGTELITSLRKERFQDDEVIQSFVAISRAQKQKNKLTPMTNHFGSKLSAYFNTIEEILQSSLEARVLVVSIVLVNIYINFRGEQT